MTAITIPPGVIVSEWIKLRSVRSTYLTMLGAILFAVVLGMFNTSSVASNWATMTAQDRASFDAVGDSLAGFQLGELAFGVLGVLAISSEYGTGMIRATLTAVPRRGTVFAAKALVVGAITLVLGELFVFATFFLGQLMLSGKHLDVSLADPGVLRTLASSGLYLLVVTMVGFGLGAIIRHSTGAVAALFGLVWLVYPVGRALESWSYVPDRLLLTNAANVLGQVNTPVGNAALRVPSLGLAYLNLAMYLIVFLGLGAWRVSQDV
ncbi:ABC transporter permease [Actinoallomurus sp. NPDC050550]|uniref:ABC transporter permease n=1 Tax=Actinoallomurus sp. NPDC050550 TaxID=3154937 RepID=UPI0033FAA358